MVSVVAVLIFIGRIITAITPFVSTVDAAFVFKLFFSMCVVSMSMFIVSVRTVAASAPVVSVVISRY